MSRIDYTTTDYLAMGIESIEKVGWFRGDAFGETPMWVRATEDGHGPSCQCLATAVDFDDNALNFVRLALGLPVQTETNDDIYAANDSQPPTEEGRQWALGVLRRAHELAVAEAERLELAERFANQEQTRAAAIDEVADLL